MNLHELITDCIRRSTANVISTMLGSNIPEGEASVEHGGPEANDGVVSLIGLAGRWAGTGSLTCSPVLACRICSLMLMTESPSVDEEVLDAVAELTNMIVGSVKNDLEPHFGPLGLSLPTVVFGRNFKTKSAGMPEWVVVRFPWDGETLVVQMCLAPTDKTTHPAAHIANEACAVEV